MGLKETRIVAHSISSSRSLSISSGYSGRMIIDQPPPADLARQLTLEELAGLLREVTGEGQEWADQITPASRLEDDLLLESIELTALAGLIRERFGAQRDLAGFLAGVDFDEFIRLTVADVLAFLAGHDRGTLSGEPL
jgi:acyl carrier protein